jgi:hypothetical protein
MGALTHLLAAVVAVLGLTGAAAVLTTGLGSTTAGADVPTPTPFGTVYALDYTAHTITSYAPGATGDPVPLSTVTLPDDEPYQMAFAPDGDVWVVGADTSTLSEYTPAQLATTGSPPPVVTISGSGLDDPQNLFIDHLGDIWVANSEGSTGGDGSVVEFTAAQLTSSGSPTPAVTLSDDGSNSINEPDAVTFDRSGTLWVANYGVPSIVGFSAAQVTSTGAPTPGVVLSSDSDHSIYGPVAFAWDRSGDLWSANYTGDTVVEFTPAQLAASGAPVPGVTISDDGSHTGVSGPSGLTFGPAGVLWVGNYNDGSDGNFAGFSPAQLATSGDPTPAHVLGGASTGIVGPSNLLIVPPQGYSLVASDGGIFSYGGAGFFGSTGSLTLNKPIVGMADGPGGRGYWLVASDGGIFTYGDLTFHGSTGSLVLNKPVVGMASTPDGEGYWLVASDGGIFAFGDATFFGSTGSLTLNKPIVGMAATPDGKGYWLVASDGGIFAYGDAVFYGSTGSLTLNKPVVGMASTPDGKGYWLVASDGGIFAFGDAVFYGSTGSLTLNKPIVGMASSPDGYGYWLVASDGGIFAYGDATFEGSAGNLTLNKPIVGMGVAAG